jgi:L-alanine-DL-glutamate epimerase-like enolase superfamily enzyme
VIEALIRTESWPIRGGFRIAHGARTKAEVVVVELHDGALLGRGECVPYARYGESPASVCAEIEAACAWLRTDGTRDRLQERMRPGAARNALDCALWDLEAKRAGRPVWRLAGLGNAPGATSTMRTVSVGSPEDMQQAARRLAGARAIKVKVDGGPDLERIAAVHEAVPTAELIVDANEAWSEDRLTAWLPALPGLGVAALEQPLPVGEDAILEGLERPVPLCADESFHDRASFSRVEGRYDIVNIKLDKAGGLTEALRCLDEARRRGLEVMVGCMVGTSLAIEPALLLASSARYVDLDGPLLLETDRAGALHDANAGILRPSASIWGSA